LAACAPVCMIALKRVLLPELGNPTMPSFINKIPSVCEVDMRLKKAQLPLYRILWHAAIYQKPTGGNLPPVDKHQ